MPTPEHTEAAASDSAQRGIVRRKACILCVKKTCMSATRADARKNPFGPSMGGNVMLISFDTGLLNGKCAGTSQKHEAREENVQIDNQIWRTWTIFRSDFNVSVTMAFYV
ncbi:hypothetical protein EO087_02595 [Dyella sp. M7H15-1]|uniref:hypothetical protein n=1 Tax=Dyella sp. M7H15-1 TaxID=2501295 RepID=UPI001004EDAC|nr:hypothetical protein [Dyella sp. M7H15-1]QAU23015.1 hypothetical protein EO087_02595 [Dyella sp. M7H15-1]